MNNNDSDLIQRTLAGDQQAFSVLVEKYQKQVHALAWQKIGDFHIAQEITQDVFLSAHHKLSTLKHHNRLAGWLYVIANNKCKNWFKKKRLEYQSLEETDPVELEEVYYSEYMTHQREEAVKRKRRGIVQKLLNKLKESDRTIVNLYYIAEMPCEDIGKFLGISPNTVRSRLHRARNQLRKEESMIKDNLSSFQLPEQMTENIMKEVTRMIPVTPPVNKPLVPLAISAASAILVVLLMGVGAQHLFRFQKPYSIEATSKPTIEIVDTPIVLESPAKPAVNNQVGRSDVLSNSDGAGQKPGTLLFASAQSDDAETSNAKPQWVQTKGPGGGVINTLFSTTRGDIYAGTSFTLYKLSDDRSSWELVYSKNTSSVKMNDWVFGGQPMFERGESLYLVTDMEVIMSTDNGETWQSFGTHPKGSPVGIAVTDRALYLGISKSAVQSNETLTEGIYMSEDFGKSWKILNEDQLADKKIRTIAAIEDAVFAGTDDGLYRFHAGTWKKLSIGPENILVKKITIPSLAATGEGILYAAAGNYSDNKTIMTSDSWWSLYRSSDLGESWESIDPRDETQKSGISGTFLPTIPDIGKYPYLGIKVTAKNKNVLLSDLKRTFYSTDSGKTWTTLDRRNIPEIQMPYPFLILDDKTFYKGSQSGVYRSLNGGESWHQFNIGLANATVLNLIVVHGKLYGRTNDGFVTSTDGGESWKPLTFRPKQVSMMTEFNNNIYLKSTGNNISIYHLSTKDNELIEIPDMPDLEKVNIGSQLDLDMLTDPETKSIEKGKIRTLENIDDVEKFGEEITKFFQEQAATALGPLFSRFAISGDTYYIEYRQKLYSWKPGQTEWYDTGLIDETKPELSFNLYDPMKYPLDISALVEAQNSLGFKLAVSGKNIYVGKRNGRLFHSPDEGRTWNDMTANLPFLYEKLYAINFAGTAIYVATDKGMAYSVDGANWHTTTDSEGTPIVIKLFTVDETTLYGVVGLQVYQLKQNSNTWEPMTPEIPSPILSLDVDGNTLYVGTIGRGVLRFSLNE